MNDSSTDVRLDATTMNLPALGAENLFGALHDTRREVHAAIGALITAGDTMAHSVFSIGRSISTRVDAVVGASLDGGEAACLALADRLHRTVRGLQDTALGMASAVIGAPRKPGAALRPQA